MMEKGERITGKISEHPAYKGAMLTKASLYDMQTQPELGKKSHTHPLKQMSQLAFLFYNLKQKKI